MLFIPILRVFDRLRQWHQRRTLNPAQALGRRGEDVAHRYLQRKGYTVVGRNWRSRYAGFEVDLIAWEHGDPDRLLIIEVKSRTSAAHGAPDRNVSYNKMRLLRKAAGEFCMRAKVRHEQVRFDILSVVFEPKLKIEHRADAFSWNNL